MTEELIDVERMMLGSDDSNSHTINWTRCSERMPPEDVNLQVILNYDDRVCEVLDSSSARDKVPDDGEFFSWVLYDEETWRKLNDARN